MSIRTLAITCSALLAGMMLLTTLPARGQESADKNSDNGEVLTRGPIHEAFADSGVTPTEVPPIVSKQPPEPINELPPDDKPEGENVQWIPGYWTWDDEREDFVWLSGIWRVPPPDRTWVPGSWRQVADGWQWTPGFWQAAGQEQVDYLPPPPEPVEAAPSTPAPSADSIYAPGTWVYHNSQYLWRPGTWLPYRPGWIWVPAHYVWTPAGWVFVEGYWDYPLRTRGLLFAPIYFTNRIWLRPGWVYAPAYAVYDNFLTGALFIRPGLGGYYFGDYFGTVYARRGFVSWLDIRFGRGIYDPMFSYYLRFNSGDRLWERDLRALYTARASGDFLPPRTLVQQTTLVRNSNVTNIQTITAIAPLTKLDPKFVKLQPVSAEQRTRERKAVANIRDASVQRQKLETQLVARGPAPAKHTDPPRTLKLELTTTTKPVTTTKPPPQPTGQALVQKPIKPRDVKQADNVSGKSGTGTTTNVAPKTTVVPGTTKKDTPPPPQPKRENVTPPAKKDSPPPQPKGNNPPMEKKDKKDKK
jgi:hypothetical protein